MMSAATPSPVPGRIIFLAHSGNQIQVLQLAAECAAKGWDHQTIVWPSTVIAETTDADLAGPLDAYAATLSAVTQAMLTSLCDQHDLLVLPAAPPAAASAMATWLGRHPAPCRPRLAVSFVSLPPEPDQPWSRHVMLMLEQTSRNTIQRSPAKDWMTVLSTATRMETILADVAAHPLPEIDHAPPLPPSPGVWTYRMIDSSRYAAITSDLACAKDPMKAHEALDMVIANLQFGTGVITLDARSLAAKLTLSIEQGQELWDSLRALGVIVATDQPQRFLINPDLAWFGNPNLRPL